ncbi:hypothetical protein [Streptomyces niveiscabiei]|uniref:Uncharacterized protein n=1 Tax=Streptomyces niveiscabiei TaxID=164115 RepID=A0ABW9HQK2_9ACTN
MPDAIGPTRAARRILLRNLLLSGGILAVLVPLAATGVLGLIAVAAGHELAEVLVIGDGWGNTCRAVHHTTNSRTDGPSSPAADTAVAPPPSSRPGS